MALSIKTSEADRLARRLAALTGESLTQAVTVALRDRLQAETAARAPSGMADRLEKIGASFFSSLANRSPVTKADYDALTEDEPDGSEGGMSPSSLIRPKA